MCGRFWPSRGQRGQSGVRRRGLPAGRFLSVSSRPAPLAGRNIEGSNTHASKTWSSVCESFTAPSGMTQCLLRRWASRTPGCSASTSEGSRRGPSTADSATHAASVWNGRLHPGESANIVPSVRHDASQVVGRVPRSRPLRGRVARGPHVRSPGLIHVCSVLA